MSSTYILTAFVSCIVELCVSDVVNPLTGFTNGSPLMPAAEALSFTGYQSLKNRIWIINDYIWYYDINTNRFSTVGTLPTYLQTINAQCSSQWGDLGIMFVNDGLLRYFKFTTASLSSWFTPLLYDRDAPCIAVDSVAKPRYIFMTGGVDTYSQTESVRIQIFDYDKRQWLFFNQAGAPYMNKARGKHACAVLGTYLYVFGGSTSQNSRAVTYNERIDISNPTKLGTKSWDDSVHYISYNNVYFHRAVSDTNYNLIYLIGGRNSIGGSESRNIQVYDPTQNLMTLISSDSMRLHYGRSSPGVIMAANRIYVFGGSGPVKTWEYSNILTFSPTSAPSASTTNHPTAVPTIPPTINPTLMPTYNPTKHPTQQPIHPSAVLTFNPTYNPTLMPTYNPTNALPSSSWYNIDFIILCITMMLSIMMIIFLTIYKFSTSDDLVMIKKIRIIAVFDMIGFFLSYLFWLICIVILYDDNEKRFNVEYIFCALLEYLFWIIGWMLFYILLIYKLYETFRESQFSMSKGFLNFHILVTLFIPIWYSVLTVCDEFNLFHVSANVYFDLSAAGTILILCGMLSLMISFNRNLFILISEHSQTRMLSSNVLSPSMNDYHYHEWDDSIDLSMLKVVTKQTLLGSIMLFVGLLYILMMIVLSVTDRKQKTEWIYYEWFLSSFILINLFCIYLGWKMNKKEYKLFCGKCHYVLMLFCESLVKKRMENRRVRSRYGYDTDLSSTLGVN